MSAVSSFTFWSPRMSAIIEDLSQVKSSTVFGTQFVLWLSNSGHFWCYRRNFRALSTQMRSLGEWIWWFPYLPQPSMSFAVIPVPYVSEKVAFFVGHPPSF
jgi:hypothetical protein